MPYSSSSKNDAGSRTGLLSRIPLVAGVLASLASFAGRASTSKPLKTVSHVDLPRYMGDWRVIAIIPYFAEKGCVDSVESYALRKDGKIDNWFTYRKPSFDAPQEKLTALDDVGDRIDDGRKSEECAHAEQREGGGLLRLAAHLSTKKQAEPAAHGGLRDCEK